MTQLKKHVWYYNIEKFELFYRKNFMYITKINGNDIYRNTYFFDIQKNSSLIIHYNHNAEASIAEMYKECSEVDFYDFIKLLFTSELMAIHIYK